MKIRIMSLALTYIHLSKTDENVHWIFFSLGYILRQVNIAPDKVYVLMQVLPDLRKHRNQYWFLKINVMISILYTNVNITE